MIRRLLLYIFLSGIAIAAYFITKKTLDFKRAKTLLIEDIIQSLMKEYNERAQHPSPDQWLERLRQVRDRYGDEIAKQVAQKLKENLGKE
jgi:hypothetical protein